jgi:hypothetical protein
MGEQAVENPLLAVLECGTDGGVPTSRRQIHRTGSEIERTGDTVPI